MSIAMDKEELLSLLGTMPAKAELNLKVIEKVDCGTFIRKKISYSAKVRETRSFINFLPYQHPNS